MPTTWRSTPRVRFDACPTRSYEPCMPSSPAPADMPRAVLSLACRKVHRPSSIVIPPSACRAVDVASMNLVPGSEDASRPQSGHPPVLLDDLVGAGEDRWRDRVKWTPNVRQPEPLVKV